MKKTSTVRPGLLAAALCALLAAPALAQLSTTANGPYYAEPSWSQKLTTNRFVVLANWNGEAVLDRETGLVWERSPDSFAKGWTEAQLHCNTRTLGGRMGWRTPSVQELASLLDPAILLPAPTSLPEGHPFLGDIVSSWSATTSASDANHVWRVRFFDRQVGPIQKSSLIPVWCVRGSSGADVQ
ncbi:MAG: DUF1566 domain-containing protein [Rubrivivax sp.]|nr:DUF1566 domain-containing protein [Rubrivivax sp.]